MKQQGIAAPLICVPGCPSHPDWLVGTVVQALKFGLPPRTDGPAAGVFFQIHARAVSPLQRLRARTFARTFGEEGCFFKLGCAGPITYTDCNVRGWNGGVNSCIRAGAPCIGCGGENFCAKAAFPLITKQRAAQDHPAGA